MHVRRLLPAAGAAALACAAHPLPASAVPVILTATAAQGTATDLDATVGPQNRAILALVALNPDGTPVSNLGTSVGDETSVITLPPGWTLISDRVRTCGLSPTRFLNQGSGRYVISLAVPPCSWAPGDTVFRVVITNVNGFNGGLLGKLTIE